MADHKKLRLEVVTPTGQALKAEADAVDLTSVMGEFEVLPGHLPVLVTLRAGPFRWRAAGRVGHAAVGPGFAEARADAVIVLADQFLDANGVDVEAAQQDLAKAEEAIKAFPGPHAGGAFGEIARDRDWAQARIDVAREI
ncbi:MAG: ATP synthase F1 subunit epsilon [Deltaproteobacteria bacterium]|nr:ATP synthase F1 subunit epsilon [Deltaproteobacteria bacterium]